MKYMLFTYRDPSVELDPEQRAAIPAAVAAWCAEMDARGVRLQGHVLGPVSDENGANRDGQLLMSEGPVEKASVHIVGFNILDCADLDEALEVASTNPGAAFGILELRPFAN